MFPPGLHSTASRDSAGTHCDGRTSGRTQRKDGYHQTSRAETSWLPRDGDLPRHQGSLFRAAYAWSYAIPTVQRSAEVPSTASPASEPAPRWEPERTGAGEGPCALSAPAQDGRVRAHVCAAAARHKVSRDTRTPRRRFCPGNTNPTPGLTFSHLGKSRDCSGIQLPFLLVRYTAIKDLTLVM